MKKTVVLAASLFVSTVAFAGPDVIIKQRAKELANQNNVRQGVAPPTQAPQSSPGQSSAGPQASAGQLALQTDLAALKPTTPATAAQKQKIAADITSMAQGAKPSPTAASKLADDISSALTASPRQMSSSSRARFAQEIDAVLNPSKYPKANMTAIFGDVQAIFQENGAERRFAAAISEDVKALQAH
jgi:hypothetical protein